MSAFKLEKVERLEGYVTKMQTTLFAFDITMSDGPLLGVLSDLLTTIDHAKKDLHWIKKEIAEEMVHEAQKEDL
jgi:hypothetical protein